MNDSELWVIAIVAVAIAAVLGVAGWAIGAIRGDTRRHREAMANIAARRQAVLDEHAAWVTRTRRILDDCVADGSLDPQTAARYRRLAR